VNSGTEYTTSFIATMAAEFVLLLVLVWSAALPSRRIWPPGRADWRLAVTWICVLVAFAGLAVGDVARFVLDGVAWRWIGGTAVLGGTALAFHGVTVIGETATVRLTAGLVTAGPYRFTRNPSTSVTSWHCSASWY